MSASNIGAVFVARNAGAGLRSSLASLPPRIQAFCRADPGSSARSVKSAQDVGNDNFSHDLRTLSAATKALHAGCKRPNDLHLLSFFIQFIDDNCEGVAGWMDAAQHDLESLAKCAAGCGWHHKRRLDRNFRGLLQLAARPAALHAVDEHLFLINRHPSHLQSDRQGRTATMPAEIFLNQVA